MIIWLPIVGFEGLYEISNTGLIKTKARFWYSGRNYAVKRFQPEQLKKQRKDKDGYLTVKLRKDGKVFARLRVHCLVLEAFTGIKPQGYQGCHKDHSKDNNNIENLYWGTSKDNAKDAMQNPNYKHPRGMLGKKHSKETREKMSKTRKEKAMNKSKEAAFDVL